MATRRLRPTVTIIPPNRSVEGCGAPRFGNRTAHEHDQNDAFNARRDWHKEYGDWINQEKEMAVAKAMKKLKEDQEQQKGGLLFFIVVAIAAAPVIFVIERMIFYKLTGW